MKIYQPMLFVGLGGTGCLIGAELERRLRDELCGPDGTDLQIRMASGNYLPYQLPGCLQFVYADLNEAELLRLRTRVVPSAEHAPAAERTMHTVTDLVPQFDTYPEVARSLRTNLSAEVAGWLPPQVGEPRVAPLVRGAGQLPTVGRAALFETFRGGLGPALRPVQEAIDGISTSGGELAQLGGRLRDSCDVFVAFSVAGGTGGGIFYDYLHLIGNAFARNRFRAQIYPLVIMPSAFDEGMGGGRPAVLNAGRALLDIFRLVDDQNGQAALTRLDDVGITGNLSVTYPTEGEIRLRASTVQTAFLFSRTSGVEREDLHRSIVSLITSLIGTDQREESDERPAVGERLYQSFADDFINRGVERETVSASAIGNRGVSTSLVASITVPVDDLADAIGSRLLARAVAELAAPPPGRAESNRDLLQQYFSAANIEQLRTRAGLSFNEPGVARGAEPILRALATRLRGLEDNLKALERQLGPMVGQLAQDFDPRRGAERLLGEVDVFRMRRILLGHQALPEEVDRIGFAGLLERRRSEPPAPKGISGRPAAPKIRDHSLGMRKVHWSDPPVQAAIRDQDGWYDWRSKALWHAAWNDQTPRWERKLSRLARELTELTETFTAFARDDEVRFTQRARDLYRQRVGVSFLLPPRGEDLEAFYEQVRTRFVSNYVVLGRVRQAATEADLLTALLGPEGWRQTYRISAEQGPAQALTFVRDRVKQEVKRLFRHRGDDERPLLPPLADLLAQAAGKDVPPVDDDDLRQFRTKLTAFIPAGFSPEGTGELKILLSYPAPTPDPDIERYLRRTVNLPRNAIVDFRPIDAEAIVVVLFRTSMGITEVPELRKVLRRWSDAMRDQQPQDFLRWRQRLGYDFGYLATTPQHRRAILHRFLCALWNDQVSVESGTPESPDRVKVMLARGPEAVSMTLSLSGYLFSSAWGELLRAYEEWTLTDDESIRRDFCAQLMSTLPTGISDTPVRPGSLFETICKIAPAQVELLQERLRRTPEQSRGWVELLLEFWGRTLPEALEMPFTGVANPVCGNLRELYEATREYL